MLQRLARIAGASASLLYIDPLHQAPSSHQRLVGTQEYAVARDNKMADVQQPAAIIAHHCACAIQIKRTPVT